MSEIKKTDQNSSSYHYISIYHQMIFESHTAAKMLSFEGVFFVDSFLNSKLLKDRIIFKSELDNKFVF